MLADFQKYQLWTLGVVSLTVENGLVLRSRTFFDLGDVQHERNVTKGNDICLSYILLKKHVKYSILLNFNIH